MNKLNKKDEQKIRRIRQRFENNLVKDLHAFIRNKTKGLHDNLTRSGVELPSVLENCDAPWSKLDSTGFIVHRSIIELMDQDPSEDFDGYNRWQDFEKIDPADW